MAETPGANLTTKYRVVDTGVDLVNALLKKLHSPDTNQLTMALKNGQDVIEVVIDRIINVEHSRAAIGTIFFGAKGALVAHPETKITISAHIDVDPVGGIGFATVALS